MFVASSIYHPVCREWSDLTPEQAGYLVQVRSPGDTLNDIVRDLAQLANITNAAILHDDSFGRARVHFVIMSTPINNA